MTLSATPSTRLVLRADTAADIMTANPVSLRADATVREAIALLTDRSIGAAPVIDEAGRPTGVVSKSDILLHDRENGTHLAAERKRMPEAFHVEEADSATVGDIMTPVLFAVSPETSAEEVVRQLLTLKVHHLFVVDDTGVLVGVISTSDVLRRLGS
jgi:CBS-domain-containing membrane protein